MVIACGHVDVSYLLVFFAVCFPDVDAVPREGRVHQWLRRDTDDAKLQSVHMADGMVSALDGETKRVPPSSSQNVSLLEGLTSCSLPACTLRGVDAPRLFVDEMSDGIGHRMKNVFDGIAIAAANGMNFGGILRSDGKNFETGTHVSEHNVDFGKVVNFVFGGNHSRQIWPALMQMHKIDKTFTTKESMEANRSAFHSRANIYIGSPSGCILSPMSKYYTDELRAVLRTGLSPFPLKFVTSGRPFVGIHDRRGDLDRNAYRNIAPEYYYNLVDLIRKILPNADVHVFSTMTYGHWTSADFDGYRSRGIHVHLDDEGVEVVWAHLAQARVFLMAKSSFSYIPAVVNPNCVITPGYGDLEFPIVPGLANWIEGTHDDRPNFNRELETCIHGRS